MEKQRWEEPERRRAEERRWERTKSEKKEEAGARKGRKVAKHCVLPMMCGSGGSRSRLNKAAGAEPCGQMRDDKLHAVYEAHFQAKMHKAHQRRTTFGRWDVEKVHAVVARSTFPSQNVQNTPFPDHVWKLRCRKSARRCGAKHVSKSKCIKHTRFGPTFGSWDVEIVHAVVARSTFRSQKWKNWRVWSTWTFRCRFAWQAQEILHLAISEQNMRVLWQFQLQPSLPSTTLQLPLPPQLHYTNYITLHYTTLTTTKTTTTTTLH